MTELAGIFNIFFGLVKAGNLSNLVNYYAMCEKFYGSDTDLDNLFVPKLKIDATISDVINTPYGHALINNNVDMIKWFYNTFTNVKHNLTNVASYNLFSMACTYTSVELVHWLITICDYLKTDSYHVDAFMSAILNHNFAVADYLCIVYGKSTIYDTCIKHIVRNLLKKPDIEILEYVANAFVDFVI